MKPYILLLITICALSCSSKKNIIYLQNTQNINDFSINYSKYKIKVDDVLKIEVGAASPEAALPYNHSSYVNGFNNTKESYIYNGYQVSQTGFINFPGLGEIRVINKSVDEVREIIYKRIVDEGILVDPSIDVKHINAHFTIIGEVNKPGKYDFVENNLNIFEAIGIANGLTITGERKKVKILRSVNEIDHKILNIDLTKKDILNNSNSFQILSGDVIIVDPNSTRVKNAGIIGNSGTLISLLSFILSSIIVISNNN